MTRPIIREHNVTTGEIVDREMTVKEFAELQANQAANEAKAEAEATKAAEKAALLTKLGITEAEAKLLF